MESDLLEDGDNLKQINALKKQLNWGELPPFYHMIANAMADLEGIHTHGFDHALKRVTDRRNWNLRRLDGEELPTGEIIVHKKPQLAIYRRVLEKSYEIQCMPHVDGLPVVGYQKGHREIDFKIWDPATMSCLIRIPNFAEFIVYAYQKGDEADRMMVHFASLTIEKILDKFREEIEIISDKGLSIEQTVEEIEDKIGLKKK